MRKFNVLKLSVIALVASLSTSFAWANNFMDKTSGGIVSTDTFGKIVIGAPNYGDSLYDIDNGEYVTYEGQPIKQPTILNPGGISESGGSAPALGSVD